MKKSCGQQEKKLQKIENQEAESERDMEMQMCIGKEEDWEKAGEQEQENGEERSFIPQLFCEDAVTMLTTAYVFVMFCIYPFYMKNGYTQIGEDKYEFYRAVTLGGFALIVPLAFICIAFYAHNHRKKCQNEGFLYLGGMSCTDWSAAAYGVSVIVSYIGSPYKETALWGDKGWFMGLVTQLLLVLSYFLVSRFWEFEEKMIPAVGAAASVVLGLGVLNRFSIYPVQVEGANNGFLSTMGNINWLCGYWAVVFPVSFMAYWYAEKLWMKAAALPGVIIGIAAGITQGSSSAFIVFAGVYLLVFALSFKDTERMKSFLELVIWYCIVCQGLRVWRILQPEAYNYYDTSLSSVMTLSRLTWIVLFPCGLLYIFLCAAERKQRLDIHRWKIVRQLVLLSAVIAAGVYVLLLVLNNMKEETDVLRSLGKLPALMFNDQWGSARGATWSAGLWTYRNIPGLRKLIGVGPDCFASFLYTIPQLAEKVIKQFDGARLTNAHNEWLTVLINNGILGFISYGGIFLTAIIRYLYHGEKAGEGKKRHLYIFAVSAFAYMIHNVVSFQQILSTPFVFLMLGMGECLIRMDYCYCSLVPRKQ